MRDVYKIATLFLKTFSIFQFVRLIDGITHQQTLFEKERT